MIDRPPAPDLLAAMADTLQSAVVPACDGAPQHAARVVANLCRILAREWQHGDAASTQTTADLASLLSADPDTPLEDLVAALDELLQTAQGTPQIHEVLRANVERRLAVAKPGYHQP